MTRRHSGMSLDALPPKAQAMALALLAEQNKRKDVTAGLPGYAPLPLVFAQPKIEVDATKKRMRQDSKPKLNKLETRYLEEVLLCRYKAEEIRSQEHRVRLANGAWYKPDFYIHHEALFIEVKGPRAWRGAFEFLKVAKAVHSYYRFVLVWLPKKNEPWQRQEVLA